MSTRNQTALLLLAVALVAAGCGQDKQDSSFQGSNGGHSESPTTHMQISPVGIEEAMEKLIDGNDRFVQGKSIHPHESADYRESLAKEQHPFATVLTCSDSRVTPVLIFDQGIGDLFVIRVAGNVIDEDVAGSIEYAVDHLGAKLLVVLGHENCGAVSAAYHVERQAVPERRRHRAPFAEQRNPQQRPACRAGC